MVHGADQHGLELGAPPAVAAGRQRPQRVAVVALPAGDDVAPLWLAYLQEVLPRELDGGFHRLGAAGDEVHAADARRCALDQHLGELLGRLGGEEAGVGIGDAVELRLDGVEHVAVAVPEAGDGRAATGVEIAPALRVHEVHALAAGDDGQVGLGVTGEHVGGFHGCLLGRARDRRCPVAGPLTLAPRTPTPARGA